MSLFDILVKQSPNKVFASLLLGIIAGLSFAFLMPLILISLEEASTRLFQSTSDSSATFLSLEVSNIRFAVAYLCLFLTIMISKAGSQIIMSNVSIDATRALRLRMYRHIAKLRIRDIESIGHSNLIVRLTTDIGNIIGGVRVLPVILINIVTIIGLLGFLVYLNVEVFLLLILTIFLAIVSYHIPMILSVRFFRHARHYTEILQESIRGLILGSKELKLNDSKREYFYQEKLRSTEDEIRSGARKGWYTMYLAISYGDLLSFMVIGLVVFVIQNYYAIDTAELIGIIMALLYMRGPIAELLNVLPALPLARISLKKVHDLFNDYPAENTQIENQKIAPWDKIILNDVVFTYKNQLENADISDANDFESSELEPSDLSTADNFAGTNFSIGPIQLELNRGETTFIVGGNGSGKSTLAKVLALLYKPEEGHLVFGDSVICDKNTADYRQIISAIYLDFYLFDEILDAKTSELTETAESYLKYFQLDDKLSVNDNEFSTIDLSGGQRKRLALLVSFLEDRDLYIFDEWAADQDPEFKEIFYTKILGDLKQKQKTVVVITHDDRYFKHADKLVTMENGKIRDITTKDKKSVEAEVSEVQLTEEQLA
ncbi:cyclic peptide export ABC transporter [Aliikangiella coralliicola]|uniref:Cyclic peptide export ABC transporter n=1 Tax=Aliikangiella coralliicola TaxID=2592383 RepID=A0A545TV56_9GAMM|nr:cyclic peptide export ABC transporter [Aliikangiella coralliicola]TQV81094.1 cyclic peptide export ABC transporter [Aliikangiella coralliicola]